MATYQLIRTVGSSFSDKISPVGAEDPSGNAQPLLVNADGYLLTASTSDSTFTVVQPVAALLNATVTGTVTANIGSTGGLALNSTFTNGLAKVQIYDPATGYSGQILPSSGLKVSTGTLLVGSVFEGTSLDSDDWTTATGNGGTTVVLGGEVEMRTNNTADGYVSVKSTRLARFLVDNVNMFRANVQMAELNVVNNVKRWGSYISTDGFFFQVSDNVISIVTRNNSVDTVVNSGSFNGGNNFVIDTNYHSYEIYYIHDMLMFLQDSKLIHKMTNPAMPFSSEYDLQVTFENVNSGGSTTQTSLFVTSGSISRMGDATNKPIYQHFNTASTTNTLKFDAGTLHKVVVSNGGYTGALITLYDNTTGSGKVIAAINPSTIIGQLVFELDFYIGLTVVTNNIIPGDFTVIYD